MTSNTKPIDEVRFGAVKAAIWRNETDNGSRFNVTFSRSYRDSEATGSPLPASAATTCSSSPSWPIRRIRASSRSKRRMQFWRRRPSNRTKSSKFRSRPAPDSPYQLGGASAPPFFFSARGPQCRTHRTLQGYARSSTGQSKPPPKNVPPRRKRRQKARRREERRSRKTQSSHEPLNASKSKLSTAASAAPSPACEDKPAVTLPAASFSWAHGRSMNPNATLDSTPI